MYMCLELERHMSNNLEGKNMSWNWKACGASRHVPWGTCLDEQIQLLSAVVFPFLWWSLMLKKTLKISKKSNPTISPVFLVKKAAPKSSLGCPSFPSELCKFSGQKSCSRVVPGLPKVSEWIMQVFSVTNLLHSCLCVAQAFKVNYACFSGCFEVVLIKICLDIS